MSARILVVDDTPRNLKLLADLLAAQGYAVVTATSGAAALAQVAAEPPDLVLLDVVMPGLSGHDVCRKIREDPATAMLPVIMVTALEASEERLRGFDAGADDFISKPINRPELLARVRSLLRIKQLYDTVQDQARQLAAWNRDLTARVSEQVEQLQRLGRLKRFLPPEVADRVAAGDADDPLVSHRREIAVVCLELRGFTAFAESTDPEDVMAVLQEHHTAIGRLVLEHQGTLERFAGDGMTIFFNDPVAQPDAAERAVRLALAIRDRSAELSARWQKRGVDLRVGIGVSQGYATLGAVGLDARSEYAAVGIVTQLAARLSEAAAPGEVLVSQRMLPAIDATFATAAAGELSLRDFARPVAAFRVLHAADGDAACAGGRVFRQEGEYWTLAWDGAGSFRLRDSKGLRYIARLLQEPDRDLHALDLVAGGQPARADGPHDAAEVAVGGLGDAGAVLDGAAKTAYRERLEDLRSELAEAESFGDLGRIESLRHEIDLLTQQLSAAVGLGGRDRRVSSAVERARVNVTRAISDAIARVREHSPLLARHLDVSIRTGTFCTYQPPDPDDVRWRL